MTADTSALEAELEKASNTLAELQSRLSSQQAVAESDPSAVTAEEKEKMEITNNLSELDQMSAQELVEAAKKGIKADFNGVHKSFCSRRSNDSSWNRAFYITEYR